MKESLYKKIIEKQDELIQVYYNQFEPYVPNAREAEKKVDALLEEIAELKAELEKHNNIIELTKVEHAYTNNSTTMDNAPNEIVWCGITYKRK